MKKKIIAILSAAALMTASMSVFAAETAYSDTDGSEEYFNSVMLLTELGIMNGYEDGSFKPDKTLTRAEFSKIIVDMLGEQEKAAARSAAEEDTIFTDVSGSHWASGYITAAVNAGIINGMGDGAFKPEASVTYAQAVKMLVCAAGYERYAEKPGGWPDGYMYYGSNLKIGEGVSAADNAEITRAQAAVMAANTLRAPVCVSTHVETDENGNVSPVFEVKNGKGADFQSILIKSHKTYEVRGHKDGNEFVITSSKNFRNEYYEESNLKVPVSTDLGTENDNTDVTAFIEDYNGKLFLIYMY